MAQNSKITKWAKDNQEALYMLYEDGVLTEDQIRTLVNLKGDYDVSKQDAEFDKVKLVIQAKLTDERIDKALKNNFISANDAKIYQSLFKSVSEKSDGDALLSSKLIDQIKNSGYKDLPLLKGMTDQLKDLNDSDTKEYIYNQRQFLNQMLPNKVITSIPDLQEYMTVQPSYGVKNTNYAKMFNDDDILDKLNEIPFRDIDYIARKNGMTGKELLNDMTEAKIAKDREAIAHGRWRSDASIPENIANEVGGTLLTLFGRRQQEAIERGEDPKLKDIAGDVGEQLAYMAPVGRIAGPVAKVASKVVPTASKVASTAANVGSNAVVPTVSELYDTMVYNDDDDNPRGEFSVADALVGTGVNAVTPYALRRAGSAVGKLTGSKDIQRTWGELAEGKTANEIVDEIENKYKGVKISDADNPNVPVEVRRRAQELKSIFDADPDIKDAIMQRHPTVFEIAKVPGKTLDEKAKKYAEPLNKDGGYTLFTVDDVYHEPTVLELYKKAPYRMKNFNGNNELTIAGMMGHVFPEFIKAYEANPNPMSDRLRNVYDKLGLGATEGAKLPKELLEEDLIKNYLTNQAGNFIYADRNVTIPGLPIDVNQVLKDQREKAEREKAKDRSRKKLPTLQRLYGNLK